jgi:AraC family transcriptional regulator
MEFTVETRPAFTVCGLRKRYSHGPGEIPLLWQAFVPRMGEIGGRAEEYVTYGVMGNYDAATNTFDYQAAVKVEPGTAVPEGMVSWDIPEQTYAVFRTDLAHIADTFGKIYGGWFETSEYRRGDGPEFEYYGPEFCPDNARAVIFLYIPVAAKA